MSKRGKSRSKRKQRERARKRLAAARGSAWQRRLTGWREAVDYADRLIARGRWQEAREALEECERANPGQTDVERRLLDVYQQLGDSGAYCRTCRRLSEKAPHDPELQVMLASGYMADARPASALEAFRRFLARWPGHPFADAVRDQIARIGPIVDQLLEDAPFPEGEKIELAALHEEVLACLGSGEHRHVIRSAERLLSRCPEFVPALNNASHAYFIVGRTDEAVAAARRALEIDPGSFHALANLARFLRMSGREEEAEPMCERLRAARSSDGEIWVKKAETFSYLGDDQAVLDAFAEAERAGYTKTKARNPSVALLHHLAAVAHARQGQMARAKHLWRKATGVVSGFDLAVENLDDAKKPPGERHGPWPFSLDYWIPSETVEQLHAALEQPARAKDDESVARVARRFAAEHREFAYIIPALLDRGDEAGLQFAWRFARLAETPELLDALREFCLSQRGPDSLRMETASYLCQQGVLPSRRTRFWVRGEWQEIELLGFEITGEPTGPGYSAPVEEWVSEAIGALNSDDGPRAEGLLKKSLEAVGDKPDLLNNLAMAYLVQGREEESADLLRQVHERWPDYFFGRVAMARMALDDGDYEQAEQYLAPLRQRQRLHRTEFTAMCTTYVEMSLRRHEFDAARSWLNMWKEVEPEHPALGRFEQTIMLSSAISKLGLQKRRSDFRPTEPGIE